MPSTCKEMHILLEIHKDTENFRNTLTRTADSDCEVSVNFSISDGTAKAGADYTANFETITFGDGKTSKTIDVAILDDMDRVILEM